MRKPWGWGEALPFWGIITYFVFICQVVFYKKYKNEREVTHEMQLTAAPILQRNHKYISNSIDEWLDIHFGDTSFNGRVVIGHRKPGRKDVQTLSMRPLTELRPYIKMLHASSRLDYYITANTVKGVNRLKDELFGLQNIVIDVDCHDDRPIQAIFALVQAFIWRSKRDLWQTGVIPTPNSIVRTGRGIQLWWALKPCYGGKDYDTSLICHDKIKNNLIGHIEGLLSEYSELDGLELDRGASINPVGYFRLPLTYNTKAKCYSSLEILHSERYDQRDLIRLETVDEPSETAKAPKQQYIPMLDTDREALQNYRSAGVRRVIQLIKLRNLRDNTVGAEMRDYFNFSVYNALRMTFDHDEAMGRLYAFNEGFKKPMRKNELLNCISSAKYKEGYRYTNTRLIELLGITPEEQEAIGLLPYIQGQRKKPNASRDEARRVLKEDRDNKILALVETGVSQAEVARRLGISKNTVGSVIKRAREEAQVDVQEVEEIIEKDAKKERPKNGSIHVLSDSRGKGTYTDKRTSLRIDLPDDELREMIGFPASDSS